MLKGNLQKNQFDTKMCSILGWEEKNCYIDGYRLVILPDNIEPEPKKGNLNLIDEKFDNLVNEITKKDYSNQLVNTELIKATKNGKNYMILHNRENHKYIFLNKDLIPYNDRDLFDLTFYTTSENYDFVLIVHEKKRESLYLLPIRMIEKLDYLVRL